MNKKKIENQYKKKIELFNNYNKFYYDKSEPIVSDKKYDELKADILLLESNYSFLDSIESPHFNLILKFNKILSKFYLINGTFFKRINILSIDKKTVKQFKKYIRLLKKILKKIKKKDKKINKNKSHLINLSKIIKLKTIKYLIIMKLVLFKNTKSFKNKKI